MKEFLVAIGFAADRAGEAEAKKALDTIEDSINKIDEADRKRTKNERKESKKRADETKKGTTELQDALKKQVRAATTQGLLIAEALGKIGERVAQAVAQTIKQYDRLYFASKETGASAKKLGAIGYAFEQIGGSADEAMSAVQSIAKAIRNNPATVPWLQKTLGIDSTDPTEVLKQLPQALAKAYKILGSQDAAASSILGVSSETLTKMRANPEKFAEALAEYANTAKQLGVDADDLAEKSNKLMTSYTSFANTIETLFQKIASESGGISDALKSLNDWIIAHHQEIEDAINNIGSAARGAAEFFASLAEKLKPVYDGFDEIAKRLTGQSGLQVLLEAFAASLTLKVLGPIRSLVGLMTTLGSMKAPAWLIGLLGLGLGAEAIAKYGPDVAKKARKPKPGEPGWWLGIDPTESREDRLKRLNGEDWNRGKSEARREAERMRNFAAPRGGRDRGETERERSLDDFLGGPGGAGRDAKVQKQSFRPGGKTWRDYLVPASWSSGSPDESRRKDIDLGQDTRNWLQGILQSWLPSLASALGMPGSSIGGGGSASSGSAAADPSGSSASGGEDSSGRDVPAGGSMPKGPLPKGKQDVARAVAEEFRKAGMSENAIAGALQNAHDESAFNPSSRHFDQPRYRGTEAGYAHGLFQMGGAEWNRYAGWLKKNYPGGDWKDPRLQARYMAWNLRTNYASTWKKLQASRSPGEAAGHFVTEYERPAERHRRARVRKYARGVPDVEHFTGKMPPPKDETAKESVKDRVKTVVPTITAMFNPDTMQKIADMTRQISNPAPLGGSYRTTNVYNNQSISMATNAHFEGGQPDPYRTVASLEEMNKRRYADIMRSMQGATS